MGYAFTSFVVAFLMFSKKEGIRRVSRPFMYTAVRIVRWVGLAAICIWILGTLWDILNGGITKRASDDYAWIYWIMVLGPLLTQLLWIEKVRTSFIGLIFIASGLIWTSGVFLEDLILVWSDIHRDYGSQFGLILDTLLEYFMRIGSFIALVWLIQSVNARRNIRKNNKLKSNT